MAVKKIKHTSKIFKASKLTRALNFSTTKGKFLIFILTFAIVGGGYMAYQSFAATVRGTNTYTSWYWPESNGYNSFEWDVTPEVDASPARYFYAHQFGLNNGDGGYFGIQTVGHIPTGKIAIFSIWGSLAAEGPGYAATFGGEGVGHSVRIPYVWQAGQTYSLRISHVSSDSSGHWWGAWIKESGGSENYVGKIKVEPGRGKLKSNSISWTEDYSGGAASCDAIPYSAVKFTNFTANGGTVRPSSHSNRLQDGLPCTNSSVTNIFGGVRHTIGNYTPVDTIPPTVSITSPTSGSRVRGSTTISANATDNVAVVKVEFYINGVLKATDTSSPYSYEWKVTGAGPYTIMAKAYDTSGNNSSSTVLVTK